MNVNEKEYEKALNMWKLSPRSIVILDNKELSLPYISLLLCSKVLSKKPNSKIIITVSNENIRDSFASLIANEFLTIATKIGVNLFIIVVSDSPSGLNSLLAIRYDLHISINSHKFMVAGVNKVPAWLTGIISNYSMILSNSIDIKKSFPDIPISYYSNKSEEVVVKKNEINQYNLALALSDKDIELSEEYGNFIKDTINIFGDIDNIFKAISANGSEFREFISKSKGWHRDLDIQNNPMDADIHRYFSPSAIYERGSSFIEITNKRKKLFQDNKVKLEVILELVEKFKDKKIVIVSKNSTFALDITELINSKYPVEEKEFSVRNLLESNISKGICANINNNVDSIPILYPKGDYIRTSSGAIKKYGVTSQNKAAQSMFNSNKCNVLSVSNSVPKYMNIAFDVLIFTSPECNDFYTIKNKVDKFSINDNGKIIYLYFDKYKKDTDCLTQIEAISKNIVNNVTSIVDI